MKKLNKRKIRWILREMKKGELSVYRIAKQQKITPRHARRVFLKYKDEKNPLLLPCGRKPNEISHEEEKLVIDMRKKHPVCAVYLEKLLKHEGKKHIPHNKIHKILKEKGLAKNEPKKQKRRKWVRYERRYSNSLWHSDWTVIDGKQFVAFEDDASRFITGYGEFSNATTDNTLLVFEKARVGYGNPKQVVTDHGSQFTGNERKDTTTIPECRFEVRLKELKIKHIKARVKHPQTNGKIEKMFHTLMRLKKHFGSMDKAVRYYNYRRPHMSLENGKLRTPYQAFLDKMRKPKNS